ncbi:hypothetical protein NPIL_121241 [Nephila pilipes]|uniref:Uncharacterized protein n=1 Tax=Nephila pilipes TaxID=299642 RepID=A0A8X6PKA4_NEPPI|nr:hypothetical protein NPIL_121241 [Nephila pilipes]
MGRTANLLVAACVLVFHVVAGQHTSSQSQQHGQQQQQHHSPAYLIPSPVTRQSGLGGALSGLGGFGGGLGGGGGLSSI